MSSQSMSGSRTRRKFRSPGGASNSACTAPTAGVGTRATAGATDGPGAGATDARGANRRPEEEIALRKKQNKNSERNEGDGREEKIYSPRHEQTVTDAPRSNPLR